MKVYIGADHAGFKLKEHIKGYLDRLGVDYEDVGNLRHEVNDDYPDYSYKVAQAVSGKRNSFGIICCGSSFGACIVANKVRGVRAVSAHNVLEAKISRLHDDANVMCIPGGDTKKKIRGLGVHKSVAERMVKTFLEEKFSAAARHHRRIGKIKKIEAKHFKKK